GLLRRFFDWFNRIFGLATDKYVQVSGALLRKSAVAVILLVAFGAAGLVIGGQVPTRFWPDEDQGHFYLHIQLPNAASLQRTREVATEVEKILADTPGVRYTTAVLGFSLLSLVRTSYNAFLFVTMEPWADRTTREKQFQVIKARVNQKLSRLP